VVPPSSDTALSAVVELPADVALHARPAAEFVKTAMGFGADVEVVFGEKVADAKSVLAVLALGAEGGSTLTLRAAGADAEAALAALSACVASLR
jgi:phosphotransferase system HPr (HPr) family protein